MQQAQSLKTKILKAIYMRSLFFLAVGVVIGILIAPEKGSVLRDKLSRTADDLAEAKKRFTGGSSNDSDDVLKMNA